MKIIQVILEKLSLVTCVIEIGQTILTVIFFSIISEEPDDRGEGKYFFLITYFRLIRFRQRGLQRRPDFQVISWK